MRSPRSSKKPKGVHPATGVPHVQRPALAWWRWLLYIGIGLVVFCTIYTNIGGVVPDHFMHLAAWRDADALGNLAIAGVFSGLIMALVKLFLDPVFLGIAQRKSALLIAEELAVSVAQAAVAVAAEGFLSAAVGGSSSGGDSESSSGLASGGGGNFGGGGASGRY